MASQFMAAASETYGFERWTATSGTVTIDSATVFGTETRSYKLNTSNPAVVARLTKNGVMADAGRRISGKFLFPSVTPAAVGTTVFAIQNSSGTGVVDINLDTAGKLRVNPLGAGVTTGTTVLLPNTPYRISLSYTITSATVFEFRLYLNGVLEITRSNSGTMTNTGTDRLSLYVATALGTDFVMYCDQVHVDDGAALTDIGTSVTSERPVSGNTIGFDLPVGADPGAGLRYQTVDDRPLDATTGRSHRGVAWVANGTLATNATTTTLPVVAPTDAAILNKIMVASIYGNNNQTVTAPAGWSLIVEVNNTANMRTSIFAIRAVAADSGATFNFTKPTDDNLLFAGVISTWQGTRIDATFLDATAASTSANALSDTVTYATYDPAEVAAFVIAAGQYNNDLTTAGAMGGTDPTYTNRLDLETAIGADCSVFAYDGESSGAATGSRTHTTTSTADAVNTGVQFGLVPQAKENYTLGAANAGDTNLTNATIVARSAWIWAKKGATGSAGTPAIMDNGTETAVVLTTTAAMYVLYVDSASYPSNAAGIGMRSSGTPCDTFLYECGTLIAYKEGKGFQMPVKRPQFYRPLTRRY